MSDTLTNATWSTLLLVCKDCGKRSNGPAKLGTKAVASEVKRLMKPERGGPKVRVVRSSCLGLCPRGALVLVNAGGTNPCVATVSSMSEVDAAVRSFRAARTTPARQG